MTKAVARQQDDSDAVEVEVHPAAQEADGSASEGHEPEPLVVRMPVDIRSVALTVLMVLALLLVLRFAAALFIPVVLAALIAYALNPVVNRLNDSGLPRLLGVVLILGLVLGLVGYTGYQLGSQVLTIVEQVPEAANRLRERLDERQGEGAIDKVQRAAEEIDRAAEQAAEPRPRFTPGGAMRVRVEEPTLDLRSRLWAAWGNMGFLAGQAVMVLFLVFFLLLTGDLYKRKLVKIVGPQLSKKKVTVQILDEINWQIGRYLLVRLGTSALVGVATGTALWAIGMQQPAVWGLMAGIGNTIPYFGAVIVTASVGVIAFLQFEAAPMALYAAAITLAITGVEGWLITPPLMGKAARMNPVAIFLSLIFWSWMWGIWGLILAVPIMVVVKSICDRVDDLQPVGELLGD